MKRSRDSFAGLSGHIASARSSLTHAESSLTTPIPISFTDRIRLLEFVSMHFLQPDSVPCAEHYNLSSSSFSGPTGTRYGDTASSRSRPPATATRIDEKAHIRYAAARVPPRSSKPRAREFRHSAIRRVGVRGWKLAVCLLKRPWNECKSCGLGRAISIPAIRTKMNARARGEGTFPRNG